MSSLQTAQDCRRGIAFKNVSVWTEWQLHRRCVLRREQLHLQDRRTFVGAWLSRKKVASGDTSDRAIARIISAYSAIVQYFDQECVISINVSETIL